MSIRYLLRQTQRRLLLGCVAVFPATTQGESSLDQNSPVDSYNSYCNNYLTINGLEKPLICDNNTHQINQERDMGETLVKEAKGQATKPQAEEKQELYSDKFAGAKTISEHFALNLAKATDAMGKNRLDLTKGERIELIDALRTHAEYEIEGDGHKIIGEKAAGQFELVLGRFELDDAKARILAYAEKRMVKSDEVEGLKKHGIYDEFKLEVHKSLGDAIDTFASQKNGKEPEVAQNPKSMPAKEVLVAQEASTSPVAPAK